MKKDNLLRVRVFLLLLGLSSGGVAQAQAFYTPVPKAAVTPYKMIQKDRVKMLDPSGWKLLAQEGQGQVLVPDEKLLGRENLSAHISRDLSKGRTRPYPSLATLLGSGVGERKLIYATSPFYSRGEMGTLLRGGRWFYTCGFAVPGELYVVENPQRIPPLWIKIYKKSLGGGLIAFRQETGVRAVAFGRCANPTRGLYPVVLEDFFVLPEPLESKMVAPPAPPTRITTVPPPDVTVNVQNTVPAAQPPATVLIYQTTPPVQAMYAWTGGSLAPKGGYQYVSTPLLAVWKQWYPGTHINVTQTQTQSQSGGTGGSQSCQPGGEPTPPPVPTGGGSPVTTPPNNPEHGPIPGYAPGGSPSVGSGGTQPVPPGTGQVPAPGSAGTR
jgi:hypothetical protein